METISIKSTNVDNVVNNLKFCNCLSKICGCEKNSPLTKGFTESLLKYFEIIDMDESINSGKRLNTIHLWGTKDRSTEDLEIWLSDYKPFKIEWIDDNRCNLVFDSITDCFKVFENFTEEYENDEDKDIKVNDSEYCLKTGIWRQVVNLPEGTNQMFMRLANKDDIKSRGSAKKSQFYATHGNSRQDNRKGFTSKSYRDNLKRNHSTYRSSMEDANSGLVVYDDLPEIDDLSEKKFRNQSPLSVESISGSEDNENSGAKKRKMLSSMKLYSDRYIEREYEQPRIKTNRKKGSVHSRLG